MIHLDYASIFSSFPPELATMLIAMIPIAELRVALPLALNVFDLPVWSALTWSIIGNLLPIPFVFYLLTPIRKFIERHSRVGKRFFTWISLRAQSKLQERSVKYGVMIGLILFVAIPLPVTGAWTGALAAFLLGIRFRRALGSIALGVIIASIIVLVINQTVISIL